MSRGRSIRGFQFRRISNDSNRCREGEKKGGQPTGIARRGPGGGIRESEPRPVGSRVRAPLLRVGGTVPCPASLQLARRQATLPSQKWPPSSRCSSPLHRRLACRGSTVRGHPWSSGLAATCRLPRAPAATRGFRGPQPQSITSTCPCKGFSHATAVFSPPGPTAGSLVSQHPARHNSRLTPSAVPSDEELISTMKLEPLGGNVVVKRLEAEQTTAGGIVLPDAARQAPQQGRVLSVGDGRLRSDGSREPGRRGGSHPLQSVCGNRGRRRWRGVADHG